MDPRSIAAMAVPAHEKRFALLIDADNVSAKYLKPILDELSKYGTVTIKRIYGDWTLSLHAKWKAALLENSITPIQQFGYTQGKNATDSAMIIDAMDILYANSVEGFCIVSSDSDFTRLAARIRESGLTVIGMGEKKTPVPFRTACDVFTTLELLLGGSRRRGSNGKAGAAEATDVPEPSASMQEIEQAVVEIIMDNTNNGKATGLGEIGSRLQKRYPDFDVRSYGTNLLSKLLSDFASVKVAKDGSNVAVELADGVSGTGTKVDELESVEKETPLAEATGSEEGEGEEGESRRGRRRRRGRRGGRSLRAAEEAGEESAEETLEVPAEEPSEVVEEPASAEAPVIEEKPKRTRGRRRAGAADATEPAVTEPAEAKPEVAEPEAAAEGEKKPARRTRGRRKAATEAAVEVEPVAEQAAVPAPDETPAEPEAAEKPKKTRTRRTRAKKAEEPKQAAVPEPEPAPEPVPAAEPAPATEDDNADVREFLLGLVREAGESGVAIGDLSKRVRGRFKGFRVTKTGFRNLRLFVESLPGIRIEKREDDNYAIAE